LLRSADGTLYQVFHQWNLVGVELQWNCAPYSHLPGHFSGYRVRWHAAHRAFDVLQPQRTSSGAVHRDAEPIDPATGYRHRGCDVQEREVPDISVTYFFEIEFRTGPGGRNSNCCQKVARLQDVQPCNVDVGTDEVIFSIKYAISFAGADHEFGIERDKSGRSIRGINCHASIRMKNCVLAVATLRSIGITDVSAGTVAGPASTVVPASSILRNVATERALVPDLRRGNYGGAF